ncbi:MAG: neutral/alkaline non-lysosomal ceramidase N-terminal domain-containing protein [Limnochordia bacterium]
MRLGTAKINITPAVGIALAGFGFRDHGSEAVRDELEARVFWLEKDDTVACIVTADIIGFGATLTADIQKAAAERFGLSPCSVFLAASHTHSGPQTVDTLLTAGGPPDSKYLSELRSRIIDGMDEARQRLRPVRVRLSRSQLTGFSINRRVPTKDGTAMAPNPAGVRDDEVVAISFLDRQSDRIIGLLFHFTCHPTVLADYTVSAEYPGAARRWLENTFPEASVGFLAGCFGDVRPHCTVIGGKRFRRGLPEEVTMFGHALAARVSRAVKQSAGDLTSHLSGHMEYLDLPLADGRHTAPFYIHRLDLARELTLIGMSGEVCCDYGLFIKNLQPQRHMIPVAYCNGLIGYIAPTRYFAEGGYEPDTSAQVYNLPAPFDPDIERIIQDSVRAMMKGK